MGLVSAIHAARVLTLNVSTLFNPILENYVILQTDGIVEAVERVLNP